MKYCRIHNTLFLFLNECTTCYLEKVEANIVSNNAIEYMKLRYGKPLTEQENILTEKMKEQFANLHIQWRRMTYC